MSQRYSGSVAGIAAIINSLPASAGKRFDSIGGQRMAAKILIDVANKLLQIENDALAKVPGATNEEKAS